jgi:hypothetical protein
MASLYDLMDAWLVWVLEVMLCWVCVENSLKRALKSSTRTPGSEDKKTPVGLRQEGGIGQSRRRRTKPLGLRQANLGKSGVN